MIKAIFVDMDGTFLDDNKSYDSARFIKQYEQLKKLGIKFSVASGNQYYQLAYYFPEIAQEISFVAENGALVVNQGTEVSHNKVSAQCVSETIKLLQKQQHIDFVVCGLACAYAPSDSSEAFINTARNHYRRLQQVESFESIDDPIIKFSIKVRPEGDINTTLTNINQELGKDLNSVTSGFSFIDLMSPGVHKAYGIQQLLNIWEIDAKDCLAMGDSNNDAEMLKFVGHSYAMGNANDTIKSIAKYTTSSNNEHGVLDVIDEVLNAI